MLLEHARGMAEALVALLAPACERIEIAGSIRRQKPNPNDIELVAVPRVEAHRVTLQQSMFSQDFAAGDTVDIGPTNLLNALCDRLLRESVLEKRPDSRGRYCWGTGIKRAVFYHGQDYAPVDLFQVVAPAEWGVIYAIRTGPGDFNRLLVTNQWLGGACPKDRKVAGGRVWHLGHNPDNQRAYAKMPASKFVKLAERSIFIHLIPTPKEEDFFGVLHVPCWPPEERTEQQLREYLRRTRMK
jgi:DNA polymerase/3'-5' exonuclease PolX